MPSAKAMHEWIKKREAALLQDLGDNETLIVEYHALSGMRLNISEVGYFASGDDALLLEGTDPDTGELCQVMAAIQTVQFVFRVAKDQGSPAERKRIGFNKVV